MDKCPFWSSDKKIEFCDKECPMIKFEEGCIFQLCYSEENSIKQNETLN